MAKVVLLSYLERNKKLSIPEEKGEGDIEYLRKEFLRYFDFEKNVKLQITFQQFDPEWDVHVDLDEDAVVQHKAKLKDSSVLMDLTDANHSEGDEGISSGATPVTSTPKLSSFSTNNDADSEELHFSRLNRKRRSCFDDDLDCSEVQSSSDLTTSAYHGDNESDADSKDLKKFVLVNIPQVVKKTKEDSEPLPEPFPLPTNFRPDGHVSLTQGKMTRTTRAAFYTSVAASMFQYKRYPSRDDYVSVARQIVAKYSFLGSKGLGSSHEGIVQTLIDRYKDMRRVRKPCKTNACNVMKKEAISRKKAPGTHNPLQQPEVPAGEDEVSFKRHNNVLRAEWTKSSRNNMVVGELMGHTFAMRRCEILEDSCDVVTLFEKFPFLQDPDQLLKELERITLINADEARGAWREKWAPKVFQQAKLEATTRSAVSKPCDELITLGENDPLIALAVLVYLLPDSRSKPDHRKALYITEASLDLKEIVKSNKQRSPYIVILQTPPQQAFLVVDKCIVCECSLLNVPLILMSAFFLSILFTLLDAITTLHF